MQPVLFSWIRCAGPLSLISMELLHGALYAIQVRRGASDSGCSFWTKTAGFLLCCCNLTSGITGVGVASNSMDQVC